MPGPLGLCNTGHKGKERKDSAALLAHGGKYSQPNVHCCSLQVPFAARDSPAVLALSVL